MNANSKNVKDHVRLWILKNYNPDDYEGMYMKDNGDYTMEDFPAVATSILYVFYREKGHDELCRRGIENAFVDWMEGLPSIIDAFPLCCDDSAADELASWFEMPDDEMMLYKESSGLDTVEKALRLVYQNVLSGTVELAKRV